MKKIISLTAALLMLALCFGGALSVSAAKGSMSATASAASVTVGASATVTVQYSGDVGIGAIDLNVTYDAAVLQYVSCSGTGFNAGGGAGVVRISYFATDAVPPTSAKLTLTFKALKAGDGNVKVATELFCTDDNDSLGTPAASVKLAVTNPTLSGNNNLKSLKPSSGTLTPKFKAGTTSYTVTVPYTTTSLSLAATAELKDAKVTVSGDNKLKVGKTTRVITVTAPNGDVKKYTVVITRSEDEKTTTKGTASTTRPTEPPADDALEVAIGDELLTVVDSQSAEILPDGFTWDSAVINGVTVSAARSETLHMTLLYLHSDLQDKSAFYIYDAAKDRFEPFRPLRSADITYILRSVPIDMEPPEGTVPSGVLAGEVAVDGFHYEDITLKDFYVVYATAPDGNTGLYVYDAAEGTLQRYHEVAVAAEDDEPVDTEPVEETPDGFLDKAVRFVTDNRTVILTCAAAVGALALIIIAITLTAKAASRGSSNCKH